MNTVWMGYRLRALILLAGAWGLLPATWALAVVQRLGWRA